MKTARSWLGAGVRLVFIWRVELVLRRRSTVKPWDTGDSKNKINENGNLSIGQRMDALRLSCECSLAFDFVVEIGRLTLFGLIFHFCQGCSLYFSLSMVKLPFMRR